MGVHEKPEQDHMFSNSFYDVLKFIAQILLPAIGTLYFALAAIWGLPAADKVVGSITVLDAFLGVLLQFSSFSYNNSEAKYDGTINVLTPADDSKKVIFDMSTDPKDYEKKDQIVFKVNTDQNNIPPEM